MTDFYKECLVEKVLTPRERFMRGLIWGVITLTLTVLAGLSLFFPLARILLLTAVAVLLLDKFYWNKFLYKLSGTVEYEYTLTNTTFDVDKIIGKSERSRLLSFDLKEITLVTPMSEISSNEYDGSFRTVAEACADIGDLDHTWCILADTERYGTLRLTFTPNDAMLEIMAPLLGRRMRAKKTITTESTERA